MRRKKEAVLRTEWNNQNLPKIVRQNRAKYKAIDQILDAHPDILDRVHEDLKRLSRPGKPGYRGRGGDFTSDTILRTLVVHAIEGLSLRDTIILIAGSDFLQDFMRTRKKAVMDFTFLDKCLLAIRPETWHWVNERLGKAAAVKGKIDPAVVRTDTTVTDANIHWPTDSSLLWDTWRVAARLLARARRRAPAGVPHRFHTKKIKRLYLFITRYIKSKSEARQKMVRAAFRTLIERVGWIVQNAREFCAFAALSQDLVVVGLGAELRAKLPVMEKVVEQATRAQIQGEAVPAAERVFSIFEPHVELIMRGRREKPVEFGHKVLLTQTKQKFITDYEVFEEQPSDTTLTAKVIERHKGIFGEVPEVLAADKGFRPHEEEYAALEEQVGTLAIPKRLRDYASALMGVWQAFRAGIEGTISGLKRAFRLSRCFYHGFKGFGSAIGLGVFSHNLVVLAAMHVT